MPAFKLECSDRSTLALHSGLRLTILGEQACFRQITVPTPPNSQAGEHYQYNQYRDNTQYHSTNERVAAVGSIAVLQDGVTGPGRPSVASDSTVESSSLCFCPACQWNLYVSPVTPGRSLTSVRSSHPPSTSNPLLHQLSRPVGGQSRAGGELSPNLPTTTCSLSLSSLA